MTLHKIARRSASLSALRFGRWSRGERMLVAAHGNSLRALVKHLDNIGESEIVELNITTGTLLYELDESLKPISSRHRGDPRGGPPKR